LANGASLAASGEVGALEKKKKEMNIASAFSPFGY
jgi:hypothetical protein